ncbi:hypothetical protein QTO34_000363 [Cnephaeus nilssonii]|uniref:RNase H type-1 domain-containing protein n=1 Tax=Cnephaeus nilssonii TaxID=3371016 RepID=A0AA40IBA6_CNENI|nr:hypothetical protein QTO34_000363 [Eptesicus nilssonii]
MVDLLGMIFQTQKPTWVDCKQLLFTFFNTEERMRVVSKARKWLQTLAPAGILDTDRWAREAFPDEEPDWNLNSEDRRARLERYQLAFLQGVRAGAKKPTNMATISEVFQKPDASPTAFYERPNEAYWIHIPFRPEAPENQTMVNATFVGQAQPDIRIKLQKLEGFLGKNATELLEIANKVFINQDRFSDLAKPLYETLKGEEKAPINWGPKQEKAFITIKAKLTEAPALGLPDVTRDFNLFVHENSGVALGVLTQEFGLWPRPVAYLSKQIDPVASGWPPCLRALAATALLVKEADKLTLGQNLNVKVPRAVVTLMEASGQHWLTHARMNQYQSLLSENPQVRLEAVRTLNPATFLPIAEGVPEHDCLEVLEEVYSSRPDLTDRPLPNPDLVLFTDGSSFLDEGKRGAGYAVVSNFETTEAQALPEGLSAQRAELWALARALELSKDKCANIYTDSRYAFATLHIHGAIYKERGLLTARGKGIKNQNEILKLLEAVSEPKEIAVIHCKGHQKGKDSVSEGNQRAYAAAKLAAKEQVAPSRIMLAPELPEPPKYTPQEEE